jgi:hypothetical protein
MSEQTQGFPPVIVTRKSGDEPLHENAQPLGPTLLDFWRWSASDLVSNATRGILAEYLVAAALGLAGGVRAEWDPFDLRTQEGVKIEVKSAGYMQSWFHKKLSTITFGIRPTRMWDADTNRVAEEMKRQADLYIFCVLNHQNKSTVDPLNVSQWDFYLVLAAVLDERFPSQKSISLGTLLTLNPCIAKYGGIATCVAELSSRLAAAKGA